MGVPRSGVVDARLGDYVRGQWPALVRYATALCGNRAEAEELVQTALVRVALRWPFVRDKDNPDGYVRRAVLNAYLNRWRRLRWRETSVAEVPDTLGTDATAGVADGLVLRYLEDRSEREAADLLGCSIGTVKSQTSKGLTKLRLVLGLPEDGTGTDDGTTR
jgi:DNA-directed RNA polymerase specialized sigma24 family protein